MTERQQEILARLESRGAMSIHELAAALFVSEASIRRDVALLERDGALRRVHGGVLPAGGESVVPLLVRDGEHSAHCLRYGQAPRGRRSGASGWPSAPAP